MRELGKREEEKVFGVGGGGGGGWGGGVGGGGLANGNSRVLFGFHPSPLPHILFGLRFHSLTDVHPDPFPWP